MSARPAPAKRVAARFFAVCLTALLLAGCWTSDPPVQGTAAIWDDGAWDEGRFGP